MRRECAIRLPARGETRRSPCKADPDASNRKVGVLSYTKQPYGIPTTYAGVRYRSRLEARWAVFFDMLGWQHAYEPEDLAGWIPDFALVHDHGPTYIEVKPFYEYTDGRQFLEEFEIL